MWAEPGQGPCPASPPHMRATHSGGGAGEVAVNSCPLSLFPQLSDTGHPMAKGEPGVGGVWGGWQQVLGPAVGSWGGWP